MEVKCVIEDVSTWGFITISQVNEMEHFMVSQMPEDTEKEKTVLMNSRRQNDI